MGNILPWEGILNTGATVQVHWYTESPVCWQALFVRGVGTGEGEMEGTGGRKVALRVRGQVDFLYASIFCVVWVRKAKLGTGGG